jgi:DNA-binding XRE family transcriptional regulator
MVQVLTIEGKRYIVLPESDYIRLKSSARELPEYPKPDAEGHYPAIEYARVSLARKIILDRERLGLTQAELARRAGIRVETLNRIENGHTTPSVRTVDKIAAVLEGLDRAE